MTVWACQPFIGETSYHDTESEAEARAGALTGSRGVQECVVYRIEIEETA